MYKCLLLIWLCAITWLIFAKLYVTCVFSGESSVFKLKGFRVLVVILLIWTTTNYFLLVIGQHPKEFSFIKKFNSHLKWQTKFPVIENSQPKIHNDLHFNWIVNLAITLQVADSLTHYYIAYIFSSSVV